MADIIIRVETAADMAEVHAIRFKVFVDEQQVPADLELEYEDESRHFLLRRNSLALATARWRTTPEGKAKVERVAVLAAGRGSGAGRAVVQAVLADIPPQVPVYIHAQISALAFWLALGFVETGKRFDEAGIEHVKMELYRP